MQTRKRAKNLGKVVEAELENLQSLDRLAWFQIGDYMAEIRRKINGHMKMPKAKRSQLDPLCEQLKEMDKKYADSMEPRVLRFLVGMRIEIARQISNGRVRPGPIKGKTDVWPKPKKTKTDSAKKPEADVVSDWMSKGFPID
ncbi:hypothetical protein HZA44_00720 [Candidatus Peregrinibacteria bacterium]|nr:hypothetical protein [Candidatus Peregrinibacteria bacterium]